ncbi:acetyltransferase [Salegentibacter maritimus]|uniref:acetyltransferase n=1 Tax=Salegentibacter maritimus TaxID=2794347 RepID=UPI0018E4A874|nr:acetyltransferase [Salegentibacter maritimus]MBI6117333.1 acetyltransferase [Salegentibacter maritimus]
MKNEKLLIYGNGHFAEYVAYVFENDTKYELMGFCIEKDFYSGKTNDGRPVYIFEEILKETTFKDYKLFIAVGNNLIRKKIFEKAKFAGYSFANYISSKANYWPNIKLGQNIFIDEGCTIQPFVTILNNNILFASNIAHHTLINSHSLISVCTTGGNVTIGEESFIGMNTTIKQNVIIGRRNVIGMGCIIESNTPNDAVYSQKGTVKRDLSYSQVTSHFLK